MSLKFLTVNFTQAVAPEFTCSLESVMSTFGKAILRLASQLTLSVATISYSPSEGTVNVMVAPLVGTPEITPFTEGVPTF